MEILYDGSDSMEVNYKGKYKNLKKKLEYLVFENECFHKQLDAQKKKLRSLNKEHRVLLDRVLKYERIDQTPGKNDSDASDSSEEKPTKRLKLDFKDILKPLKNPGTSSAINSVDTVVQSSKVSTPLLEGCTDGHMTREEVERHLESRHSYALPERTPLTVPKELFSHEGSHDSDFMMEPLEEDTSPSNGEQYQEVTVDSQ